MRFARKNPVKSTLKDRAELPLKNARLSLKNAALAVKDRVKSFLAKTGNGQLTWPGYLLWGRIRISTVVLVLAFLAVWWAYGTYEPPAPPKPTPVPNTQVVPPGFVPDPSYTWVPRTRVQPPPYTPTPPYTPPPTTTATTTTTTTPLPPPPPLVLPPPFGPPPPPPPPG